MKRPCGVVRALLWVSIVAMSGCTGERGCSRPGADAVEKAPPEEIKTWMKSHGSVSESIRDALVQGDERRAKVSIRRLTEAQRTRPFERIDLELGADVRRALTRLADAEDLETMAVAFARLTYACGNCHRDQNVGPAMKLDPVPLGGGLSTHMRRHYWSVTRMWEAVLAHSEQVLTSSARALQEAPLHGDTDPEEENPVGASALAKEVHQLAHAIAENDPRSADTEPPLFEKRVDMLGQMMHACGRCHQLTGVVPSLVPLP